MRSLHLWKSTFVTVFIELSLSFTLNTRKGDFSSLSHRVLDLSYLPTPGPGPGPSPCLFLCLLACLGVHVIPPAHHIFKSHCVNIHSNLLSNFNSVMSRTICHSKRQRCTNLSPLLKHLGQVRDVDRVQVLLETRQTNTGTPLKAAVSPIIPSVPKCSSRHFIFHRKCMFWVIRFHLSHRLFSCLINHSTDSQPSYSSWRLGIFWCFCLAI